MKGVRAWVCALAAVLSVACGGAEAKVGATAAAPPKTVVADEAPPNPQQEVESGAITRSELDDVLAGGPGRLLGWVTTEPFRLNGKFVGFRIATFTRGAPQKIDLRVGDVILAVNERSIERPEHLYQIFEALASADELVFELLRSGERLERRYPIVD